MYHLSKLKNGITLITVPVEGTMATTVLAMFPVGSRYETKKLSGASHFVEHMLFKGTQQRPTAQDISRTLEAVGADYNAYTYKDYTGYYVKIDSQHQELAFDLLSDMIFHSKIEQDEVEREKGAIVEELRMYLDNPTMAIDILADRLAFGGNQLGWDIGGTETTVRGMTRPELWGYYQRHYAPRNMVLAVAGNITEEKMKKFVHYFEREPSFPSSVKPSFYDTGYKKFSWPRQPPAFSHRIMVQEKKVDQTHVIMSFPGLQAHHPDRYALSVLLNILGGGMSSRLFVEVRERRGLAYMVKTGSSSFRDTGVTYVQAGLDPARLPEAITTIRNELLKITEDFVEPDELEKSKNNFAGRMALGMEDSSSQAEWYAKYFLFSPQILTYDQVVERIRKVTARDVRRVAQKLLSWKELRLAVIGPFRKKELIKMIK